MIDIANIMIVQKTLISNSIISWNCWKILQSIGFLQLFHTSTQTIVDPSNKQRRALAMHSYPAGFILIQ